MTSTEPASPPLPDPVAEYQTRVRRARIRYAIVLTVIAAVAATIFGVVVATGEAAHATLRTVGQAPPALALAPADRNQTPVWRDGDRAALGSPQWDGTIVTYDTHTVRGRNARTGVQTWSYTRTDRTVCTAAQIGGTTIAVFARDGACDQLTGVKSGTGQRVWDRTLDEDGHPVEGTPAFQATTDTFLVTSPSVIYALDAAGGGDRWMYSRPGCRIGRAVLGSSGALISQNCATVRCGSLKFCARGPQLFLRDAYAGKEDSTKPNFDHVKWNDVGTTAVPVTADQLVTAAGPGARALQVLAADSGKAQRFITVPGTVADPTRSLAQPVQEGQLVWLDGTLLALGSSDRPLWTRLSTPATLLATDVTTVPSLSSARITTVAAGGVTAIDGSTGDVIERYPTTRVADPGASLAYPVGNGFVVSGPAGVQVYR